MADNRPQGRKTQVTGQSTGAYRRGSGLNTGPVGSANSNPHSQRKLNIRLPVLLLMNRLNVYKVMLMFS